MRGLSKSADVSLRTAVRQSVSLLTDDNAAIQENFDVYGSLSDFRATKMTVLKKIF